MGISNLTGKPLKNVKQSAISDHLLQCSCTINFDNFDIIAAESNKFKLLLKESLLIKRDKPILNTMIKSFPLELLIKMTVLFLLFYYHMIIRVLLIYSSDFNARTDRSRICFNMSS